MVAVWLYGGEPIRAAQMHKSVNTLDVMRESHVRIKHKYLMAYRVISVIYDLPYEQQNGTGQTAHIFTGIISHVHSLILSAQPAIRALCVCTLLFRHFALVSQRI